jgi:hypothetical protein
LSACGFLSGKLPRSWKVRRVDSLLLTIDLGCGCDNYAFSFGQRVVLPSYGLRRIKGAIGLDVDKGMCDVQGDLHYFPFRDRIAVSIGFIILCLQGFIISFMLTLLSPYLGSEMIRLGATMSKKEKVCIDT